MIGPRFFIEQHTRAVMKLAMRWTLPPPLPLVAALSWARCSVISQIRVQLHILQNADGSYNYRPSPVSTVDGSGNPNKLACVWNKLVAYAVIRHLVSHREIDFVVPGQNDKRRTGLCTRLRALQIEMCRRRMMVLHGAGDVTHQAFDRRRNAGVRCVRRRSGLGWVCAIWHSQRDCSEDRKCTQIHSRGSHDGLAP